MAAKTTEKTVRRTRKASSVPPPVTPDTMQTGSVSLDEEIRRRAYEIYLERGSTPGNEGEDWLVAEREVRARAATASHSA